MGESVQVEGSPVGSAAEETEVPGRCCGAPTAVAAVEPVASGVGCCG
jgi:hypothetical protein